MSLIGIQIPHQVARLLQEIEVPGAKMDSASLHITLFHFDKFSIKSVASVMESAYNISKTTSPFSIEIRCVDYFPVKEGRPYPIITPVISPKLHNLRKKIQKSLDDNDLEYSKTFKDYKPHITLSTSEEKIKKTKITPIEFSVQELVIWAGDNGDDKMYITLPLTIKKDEEKIICEVCE
jgi:2'-5' RNA ligase